MANGTGTPPPDYIPMGFEMDENSSDPATIVLNFCKAVPDILQYFFDNESFRKLVDSQFVSTQIDFSLFMDSFKDSKRTLLNDVSSIEDRVYEQERREYFRQQLEKIGFTGSSLELKARLFNSYLKSALDTIKNIAQGIIDFALNPIVKVIRKLLSFLNKLFESLKIVIPGIDAIKEIKDVGEEYLSIADEEIPSI